MADDSTFGGGLATFGGGNDASAAPGPGADVPSAPAQPPSSGGVFGSGISFGAPSYRAPDPQASALDQTADTLQQRIQRANQIASNPLLQIFSPEGVQKARDFVPAAAEKLQQIRTQQAGIKAGQQQAETLGLAPGEVADEATQADRVEVAKARALKGDLRVFKGLQAVDPKAAEAIQDQVQETVAGHLTKAQFAFDKLSNMTNQGEYAAAVTSLRKEGALTDLEALGLKVPPSFEAFSAGKGKEASALRDARIGIDTVRQKLEERNTYQPMEKKEAETYNGRLTTVYGDQVTNGTWGRNGASGTRGLIVNGAADPRDLGKKFTLATPEQRKAIKEEFDGAVPKEDIEKFRAFTRTYDIATKDAKGNALPADKVNTNPNVQQGIAEGLASMLRGGSGGANVGLLKIELAKRGWAQGAIDGLVSNYAGAMNTLFENEKKPYLSTTTQKQIRDVMDALQTANSNMLNDRAGQIAQRAGALGLDSAAFGLGKNETKGPIETAMEAGRQAQIERMSPNHQAIGGGDGVFQLGAQRPGAGATASPQGTAPTTQLPGAQPLATPVQQAASPTPGATAGSPPPAAPSPGPGGAPAPAVTQPPGPAGGGTPGAAAPVQPQTIAGQQISVPMPQGVSPKYVQAMQRIESGREKDPWTAGAKGTSASGAFQFTNATWAENKPVGAPDRAGQATPEQQATALANLTQKNANTLDKAGLPVNDLTVYVAHNLGGTGAQRLLKADPNADARTVVGDVAARNNPLFYRGKPTVAQVLQRYHDEMGKGAPDDEGPKPKPGSGGATADQQQGMLSRVASTVAKGVLPGGAAVAAYQALPEGVRRTIQDQATEHAPAIGSTVGAVAGGAAGGVPGAVAGGTIGGGGGQMVKDYLQGREQNPHKIAEEAALGGVLGIVPEGRPVVGALARTAGAGGVEAGAEAARGGDAEAVTEAGLKGGALAAGGELFGRALGMVGHKVWNMFSPDAKTAVRDAAKQFSDAETTLATETPKLPGANGAAATVNPKYEAAEKARTEAETTLKDAGLKPDEAAYAHKVSSEGVPKQEAQVSRPGALEQQTLGKGYDRLRDQIDQTAVGAPKASPKLSDGPIAAAETAKMAPALKSAAERTEMAITQPAANWTEKWTQLTKARSDLLELERDAMSSTTSGRTQQAKDYRALADAVRTQQEKAAKYVFGDKDGEAFMKWTKVLDARYARLMEATNGGDLAKAAALKGEAGREAERKFMAFAAHDPQAQAAYKAMRGNKGDVYEGTVPWTVAAEGIPGLGKIVKVAKISQMLREWARERAAGSPVTFADMVPELEQRLAAGRQTVRDIGGAAGSRAATM